MKMSSALVRQALEFVDQEGGGKKKLKTRADIRSSGQDHRHPYKRQSARPVPSDSSGRTQQNIDKLLKLSALNTDSNISEKLVERAIKGKPLLDKIKIKTEEEKSILFPEEESFGKFEKEYFCS